MIELIIISVAIIALLLLCHCIKNDPTGRNSGDYYNPATERRYVTSPPSDYYNSQRCAYQSGTIQNRSAPSHRKRNNSTPLHGIIQHVVKVFETQRQQNYQFAVLFLSSETNITRRVQYRTKSGIVDSSNATNRSSPTFPLDRDVCNYITARPDGRDHAEKLIMDKFHLLLRDRSCRSIVLYTWLLPCKGCTRRIRETLGPYAKDYNITVVYTYSLKGEDDPKEIEEELRLSGITLKQEAYDEDLEEA